MVNIPPHIRQQYPSLPPHVQSMLADQAQAARGHYAAQVKSTFGAIAHSSITGRFGWSWGAGDASEAEQVAIRQVGATDADCKVWGSDVYLALVRGPGGGIGWGWNRRQDKACQTAFQHCQAYETGCELVLLFHTDVGTDLSATVRAQWEAVARRQWELAQEPARRAAARLAATKSTYAAVAWSPSTGCIGYCRSARTLVAAEKHAIKEMAYGRGDARVVVSGYNTKLMCVIGSRWSYDTGGAYWFESVCVGATGSDDLTIWQDAVAAGQKLGTRLKLLFASQTGLDPVDVATCRPPWIDERTGLPDDPPPPEFDFESAIQAHSAFLNDLRRNWLARMRSNRPSEIVTRTRREHYLELAAEAHQR